MHDKAGRGTRNILALLAQQFIDIHRISRSEFSPGIATLMSSFGTPQKLRQQRLGHADGSPITESVYTHVISEDGKRVAAKLGDAAWGVLDASWTEKKNGSGVEAPKPFAIN